MDFDPRDYDSRDDERHSQTPSRGGRTGSSDRDRDDDWSQPAARTRDRDDDDARSLGRGPGNERQGSDGHGSERDHDPRWTERDRDDRERDREGRDAFTRHLHLPRGLEREHVRDRDREYTLRGSESRTLATVGAFRVVSSRDLRDHDNRPADPRSGDLRHLREQGLIETTRVPGYRDHAVSLTKDGRSLLESHRDPDREHSQTFYAGLGRERELEHDLQVYRAYEQAEVRLQERGAHIERVVLDHELKGEYQRWLHERDKDHDDYDGHPDRTPDEIREWAYEHDLPYFDDEVHFPDVRLEYQEPDGRWEREDIEVVTSHYRGAHGACVARSGFSCYRGWSLRLSTSGAGRRGGRNGGLAEELWR
jgi:DNA-binding MarR family transcriptional regulator